MSTLAEQIADLETRAAEAAELKQRREGLEALFRPLAAAFGFAPMHEIGALETTEDLDRAQVNHLFAERDALKAERDSWRTDCQQARDISRAARATLVEAYALLVGKDKAAEVAGDVIADVAIDLKNAVAEALKGLRDERGEMAVAFRLLREADRVDAEDEAEANESHRYMASCIRTAVSGLLEDVPEPADMERESPAPLAVTPLRVGAMGECEVNGEMLNAVVLVGERAAIATWARAGALDELVLPILTSKMAMTPAKSAAPQAVERGEQVEHSPATAAVPPVPSSSGLWVVTRRDKSGRRFFGYSPIKPWGELADARRFTSADDAEKERPRGAKVIALAGVPQLLERDKRKADARTVFKEEAGELQQYLAPAAAERPPLGTAPVLRVVATEEDEGGFVVCHASDNGKRHWLTVDQGLTSDGRASLTDALGRPDLGANSAVAEFEHLHEAREAAEELRESMPHGGGTVEVHDLGTVVSEEEQREEAEAFPDRSGGDLEQQVDAALEHVTPFDGDAP